MSKEIKEVVVVAYGRSPVGKAVKGSLKDSHPVDYAAEVLKGVLAMVPKLEPAEIEDLIIGCAYPERKMGSNMGRLIALRAGLPYSVPGQVVNRFCSSGLQAIGNAANAIAVGQNQVIVAGGCEQMSKNRYDPIHRNDWLLEHEAGAYMPMGITAENVAARYHVTREDCDEFAAISHRRAAAAQNAGKFLNEIIPVTAKNLQGEEAIFALDEGIRADSTAKSLSTLPAAFLDGGVVTAGNSSQISDGAGMVVLMSREKADKLGIKPIARFLGYDVSGVDPAYMGIGPIVAIPKVLARTGVSLSQIDVIELNEAFATQSIACIKELGLNSDKVNPNGGAIALGHPLGATGAILTCKLLSELTRTGGKYGMVTMCIGGGMGAAGVFEML